jgi:pyruvate ferredoxin oxidoreductase alpha subunit
MSQAKRIGLEVSLGIAEAVKLCDADAIAAYPITPQTHVVEHLAELVADGHLDAEFIPVESEHSAMSACIGTAAAGARTFTATASQGLALMIEIMYIASSMRFPIVMAVANRALSAPISIWGDHSDAMLARDAGWIQYFCENGQEAYDLTICSFKIAEDHRVMLPLTINFDGFTLSHVVEPLIPISQEEVTAFLPIYEPVYRMDPKNPVSMGPVGMPEIYTEAKKAHDEALTGSKEVIREVWDEFAEKFGRQYNFVEKYRTDEADTILVGMGALTETARGAIDSLRDKGKKVGLVRIRLWRPFPFEEIREALSSAKTVVCFDRALSPGGPGGPMASEVKNALYNMDKRPAVVSLIGGLGGRDVRFRDFAEWIEMAEKIAAEGAIPDYEIVGVRE